MSPRAYLRERSRIPHRIGSPPTQSALLMPTPFDPALPRAGQGSLRRPQKGGIRRALCRGRFAWVVVLG